MYLETLNNLYGHIWQPSFFTGRNEVGQGNIFTSVCQEFCPQGGSASVHAPPGADTPSPWSRHPPRADPPRAADTPQEQTPPGSRLQHTVNERPVCILLEFGSILVMTYIQRAGVAPPPPSPADPLLWCCMCYAYYMHCTQRILIGWGFPPQPMRSFWFQLIYISYTPYVHRILICWDSPS